LAARTSLNHSIDSAPALNRDSDSFEHIFHWSDRVWGSATCC